MLAVVELGGKQYTVTVGQTIEVDNQDVEAGKTLEVAALLTSNEDGSDAKVGTPTVEGSKVTFKVIENFRDEKVRVFKMKSKKRYARTKGFRAALTQLEVISIA
jgi:large subunit ribosomal protein L21